MTGSIKDLLGDVPFDHYPITPGHKARDTSRDAARSIAPIVTNRRAEILAAIAGSDGLTADEVAKLVHRTVLAVRPRVAELARSGRLVDSGLRRKNESGKDAIVWTVARNEGARK